MHKPSSRGGTRRSTRRLEATCRNSIPDFSAVSRAALPHLPVLLARWLPGGRRQGSEYVALNPKRVDHTPGSFRINLRTGKWADFATTDRGSDVVSLAAFLSGLSQTEAARALSEMLGVTRG